MDEKQRGFICVYGGDVLSGDDVLELVAGSRQPYPRNIPADCINRLLQHLEEPYCIAEERRPLRLSSAAYNVATNPAGARIRRVRGATGSGKSLGLAARAARLAAEGKEVLVLSYNITLAHYLHDRAAQHCRELGTAVSAITFVHFHGFCSWASAEAGGGHGPDLELGDESGADRVVHQAQEAYKQGRVTQQFDVILVDEGQDFRSDWWNFLRGSVLREGGEMLLAVDQTQHLYKDRPRWTDVVMHGCGFRGPWTELSGCYRLPPDLIPAVAEFAERYLDGEVDPPTVPEDHPQLTGMAVPATIRRWCNARGPVDTEVVAQKVVREVELLINGPTRLAYGDVVFLCETHEVGLRAAELLEEQRIPLSHIFTAVEGRDRQRRKHRFWGGASGVKGCTVHSFKGWEARGVVLVIGQSETSRRLAYVAMSRVSGSVVGPAHVTVINGDPGLKDFGPTFKGEAGLEQPAA